MADFRVLPIPCTDFITASISPLLLDSPTGDSSNLISISDVISSTPCFNAMIAGSLSLLKMIFL
jgi:hypothetical protein